MVDSPITVEIKEMVRSFYTVPERKIVLPCILINIIVVVDPGHKICFMIDFGPNSSKSWSESFHTHNIQKLPQ